jgi:hypothetical protein
MAIYSAETSHPSANWRRGMSQFSRVKIPYGLLPHAGHKNRGGQRTRENRSGRMQQARQARIIVLRLGGDGVPRALAAALRRSSRKPPGTTGGKGAQTADARRKPAGFFETKVRHCLRRNAHPAHSGEATPRKLDLTNRAALLKGGTAAGPSA